MHRTSRSAHISRLSFRFLWLWVHPVPSCCVRFQIILQRKICEEKQWTLPNIRGLFHDIYEEAWELVTTCREIFVKGNSSHAPPPPSIFPDISPDLTCVSSVCYFRSYNIFFFFLICLHFHSAFAYTHITLSTTAVLLHITPLVLVLPRDKLWQKYRRENS